MKNKADSEQGKGPAARPSTIGKHTPGPWEVLETPESSNQNWIVVQHLGGSRKRCSIASLYFNGDEEANARLIASAPALADALQALVARLDGHTAERFLPLVEDARAALRAAGRLADEPGTALKAPTDPTPSPKASP